MDLNTLVSKPSAVVEISQKEPSIDGFSVKLEGGEMIDISGTEWHTGDRRIQHENDLLFSTTFGRQILITKEQVDYITTLGV